jgi:ATP-dependent helicase/nuclease subunit A
MLLWPPRRVFEDRRCRVARAEADRLRDQEYRRLLYVAMTRAEDRLYICGWRGDRKIPDDCWYNLVKDGLAGVSKPLLEGFEEMLAAEVAPEDNEPIGLHLSNPQTVPAKLDGAVEAALEPEADIEPWMREAPPPEPSPPHPIVPSRPSGDPPPVHSPLQLDDQMRFQRGLQVHRLLQILPGIPESDRHTACLRLLERSPLAESDQHLTSVEVMKILESVEFQPLFGPNSRAEVPVIGTINRPDGPEIISGQVDRLVIRDNDILIVDYKTNRPPPTRPDDVSSVYLRQMAAYRDILKQIWPGKDIVCALLWTDGPRIMSLPEYLLDL